LVILLLPTLLQSGDIYDNLVSVFLVHGNYVFIPLSYYDNLMGVECNASDIFQHLVELVNDFSELVLKANIVQQLYRK
jgi:hypothetical protein